MAKTVKSKSKNKAIELGIPYSDPVNKANDSSVREGLQRTLYQELNKLAVEKAVSKDHKTPDEKKAEKQSKASRKKLKKSIKQAIENNLIRILNPICCGIDVHKEVIVACLRYQNEKGERIEEIREFSGFTDDLLKLRNWLLENDCPIIAMESTGIYWRPLYNVLEGVFNVTLVNARHFKNVPGRKTDISDSKWLAELLQFGLLRGSFIPLRDVRDWRDLARSRKKITKDIGNYKRRAHKVFETANIKIDSVASDLFGVTGRNLIDYVCSGEEITPEGIDKRAKGKLRNKLGDLYRSLQGFFRDHHRFMILYYFETIDCLEKQKELITERLAALTRTHEDLLVRLDVIPGINELSAQSVIAELGTDLSSFANEHALSCWAGVAPGNNQSAGKRYSGKSPVRKHPLKEILVECAWAAIKKENSYYRDKYYRLKSRRGAKKAIVAIAHRILKAIYFIIKDGAHYKELGGDFLQERRQKNRLSRLKREAEINGYELVPKAG